LRIYIDMRFLSAIGFVLLLGSTSLQAQTLPARTQLSVRLDANISSRTARVGDIVPASLVSDLFVNGAEVAPRGTPVRVRVTYARRSGRFHHSGYLTIRLESIDIDGRRFRLESTAIRDKGNGHTRSNVEKIGGGAGLGAIIGAIAGGGKGSLIGGLIGAGAGTGLAAATGRQPAEFHAEEVFDFTLTAPAKRIRHHRRWHHRP
jgi:hypothetical protein